jgi:hypothetical protein
MAENDKDRFRQMQELGRAKKRDMPDASLNAKLQTYFPDIAVKNKELPAPNPLIDAKRAEAKEAGVPDIIFKKTNCYMDICAIIDLYKDYPKFKAEKRNKEGEIVKPGLNCIFEKAHWTEYGRIVTTIRNPKCVMPSSDDVDSETIEGRIEYAYKNLIGEYVKPREYAFPVIPE